MSERPQAARVDDQEDLFEQIITQELEKRKAPAQAAAAVEAPGSEPSPAPKPEDSVEAASPAGGKTKRSAAVYLYLLILFGAAFLMLLLAYFIQQRSSEDIISDLRESMNLSRQELLDEIRGLESQIAALEDQNTALEGQNDELREVIDLWQNNSNRWQKQYKEKVEEADGLREQYFTAREVTNAWHFFWKLEQYYQAGDYKSCAALLLLEGFSYQIPESARERHEEIVQAVIDAGILAEDYDVHVSDYEDLIDRYLAEHPDHSHAD